MTSRAIWGTVLALALLVLGGAWWFSHFEQVPAERWSEPDKEARRNRFLALERFTTTMGRPFSRVDNASYLDKLPAGGVVILDAHRRAHLTPKRVERLLDWVKAGGYLIVVPEAVGVSDPILDFFHVDCGCDSDGDTRTHSRAGRPPDTVSVDLPGAKRALRIDFVYAHLNTDDIEPEWSAGAADYSDQILHFQHGAGNVTAIADFSRLYDNRRIGHHDHAELLWTLLETYQPDRTHPVVLITQLSTERLWEWLAESAWMAVVAGVVLLLLWLWSVVPRFGPPRPEPEPARRELGEHLAAVGRFVWRAGGLEHWLEAARESFRTRLALRHPAIHALPPAEQAVALAELTQRPASLIAAALHQPAGSPQSFTLAVRTLRNLERIL